MNKQTLVNVLLTIPLRDYAALEDLANQLDIKLEVLEFKSAKSVTQKSNGKIKRSPRHRMDSETTKKIWALEKENPSLTVPQIKQILNLPHSNNTIWRARHNTFQKSNKN